MNSITEKLYKKFEDIPSRKGRGGTYQYVRWQDVADRMNEVFGSRWSSEVVFQDVVGKNIIVRVSVCIKDPDTGERFCQEGFGGAVNDDAQEAGNAFKAAYSKALKDACKKWGVGLYLDDEDNTNEIPTGYIGKEYGVPPRETFTATPSTVVPEQQLPPSFPPQPDASVVETEFVQEGEDSIVEEPIPTLAKNERSIPSFPPIPSFPSTEKVAVPSKYNTIKSGDVSDVQRVALHSILKRLNVGAEVLIKEAFETNGLDSTEIPNQDELTYHQAVHVIKYGNDKFRGQ